MFRYILYTICSVLFMDTMVLHAFSLDGLRTAFRGGKNPNATAPGDTVSIHMYATNDLVATVEGASYFDDAADYLKAGDIIMASGDLDGTPWQKSYVVKSISAAGVVVVTPAANVTYVSKYVMQMNLALTDGTYYLGVAPITGTVDKIYTHANGAVTTNNAVCTFKIDGTDITDGVVTIASGGSAGDIDSATPSAANSVTAGEAITCVVSNTPGGSKTAEVTILISPS